MVHEWPERHCRSSVASYFPHNFLLLSSVFHFSAETACHVENDVADLYARLISVIASTSDSLEQGSQSIAELYVRLNETLLYLLPTRRLSGHHLACLQILVTIHWQFNQWTKLSKSVGCCVQLCVPIVNESPFLLLPILPEYFLPVELSFHFPVALCSLTFPCHSILIVSDKVPQIRCGGSRVSSPQTYPYHLTTYFPMSYLADTLCALSATLIVGWNHLISPSLHLQQHSFAATSRVMGALFRMGCRSSDFVWVTA